MLGAFGPHINIQSTTRLTSGALSNRILVRELAVVLAAAFECAIFPRETGLLTKPVC